MRVPHRVPVGPVPKKRVPPLLVAAHLPAVPALSRSAGRGCCRARGAGCALRRGSLRSERSALTSPLLCGGNARWVTPRTGLIRYRFAAAHLLEWRIDGCAVRCDGSPRAAGGSGSSGCCATKVVLFLPHPKPSGSEK